MTMKIKLLLPALLLAALPYVALAGPPPDYQHAFADLHRARHLLEEHGVNSAVKDDEGAAVIDIDKARDKIREALADIGQVPVPVPPQPDPGPGRLHDALELLQHSYNDLNHPVANPAENHHREEALKHVNDAIQETQKAISEV